MARSIPALLTTILAGGGTIDIDPDRLESRPGQFKTPFTREFITALADVETSEGGIP